MSYAEMLLAMVPAAPPTRKNQRATSCPAPISANVPYLRRVEVDLQRLLMRVENLAFRHESTLYAEER